MPCLLFKTVDSGAQKQMNKLFQKGLRKIGIFAKIKVRNKGEKTCFATQKSKTSVISELFVRRQQTEPSRRFDRVFDKNSTFWL